MSGLAIIRERITISTILACTLSCIAYEAIRTNGWLNRFASQGITLFEAAVTRWEPHGMAVYAAIFLAVLVVICNQRNPRIQLGWFFFSVLMLVVACLQIPGARVGRFGSTSDLFTLFYLLVVPLPALVFVVIGLVSKGRGEPEEWTE